MSDRSHCAAACYRWLQMHFLPHDRIKRCRFTRSFRFTIGQLDVSRRGVPGLCPWNRFSKPQSVPAFLPNEQLLDLSKADWHDLTEEVFRELFRNSALKRTKFEGLKRNIQFLNPQQ